LRKRLERERRGLVLVEGHRAVRAALESGVVAELFFTPGARSRRADLLQTAADIGVHAAEVTTTVMGSLTTVVATPDIFAVASLKPASAGGSVGPTGVILSNVRDPASAGGIMATAAAMGMSGIVAVKGTADLFDPKAIRAGQGAHFLLPVMRGLGEEEAIDRFRDVGARIVTLSEEGSSPWEADLAGPLALVVCGRGLPPSAAILARTDTRIKVEGSISIAAASAIVLYERRRQGG